MREVRPRLAATEPSATDLLPSSSCPPRHRPAGFAPEITGSPISEEDVIRAATETKDGIPYYQW